MAIKLTDIENVPSLTLGEFKSDNGVLYVGTTDFGLSEWDDGGTQTTTGGLQGITGRFAKYIQKFGSVSIPEKSIDVEYSFIVPEPPEPVEPTGEGLWLTTPTISISSKEVVE